MKKIENLQISQRLTKTELKKIRGGVECTCYCNDGVGKWTTYYEYCPTYTFSSPYCNNYGATCDEA